MKLVSLNTWGGTVHQPFLKFVKEQAPSTDIFCFQEIYTSPEKDISPKGARLNIFEDLRPLLPEFDAFFCPIQDGMDEEGIIDFPTTFGMATFVRNTYTTRDHGFIFGANGRNTLQGNDFSTMGYGFHHCVVETGSGPVMVVNMYGIAQPGSKLDTPVRLRQSTLLKELIDSAKSPVIVCGDFNLFPETKSVTMLEETMRNLIKERSITDTRGAINLEKYPGQPPQYFADYTFVSPDIQVHSFEVPQVRVSDHLPMILAFDTIQAPRA